MDVSTVVPVITTWLKERITQSGLKGFVVGISGGVDSALVSTLCAETGLPVLCVSMPIYQAADQLSRADSHMAWLKGKYPNVTITTLQLSHPFGGIEFALSGNEIIPITELALANTRARIRMATLYAFANSLNYLVAGTGNKVEDFGVGFFTKYGDGGVDISPIGDLLKTEVRDMAAFLGVSEDIVKATPTDGLWADNRSDEGHIGATYPQLEAAMAFCEREDIPNTEFFNLQKNRKAYPDMDPDFERVVRVYLERHENSAHKMSMPPVCRLYE